MLSLGNVFLGNNPVLKFNFFIWRNPSKTKVHGEKLQSFVLSVYLRNSQIKSFFISS